MLGIFLFFFYSEFVYFLKMGHLKKKSRRYIRYFYLALMTAFLVGGILKRRVQMSHIHSR